MRELQRHRTFAHGGRDSLDGAGAHVTGGEDAGELRLQKEGLPLGGARETTG